MNKTMDSTAIPSTPTSDRTEVATLGGGCFWCVEAVLQDLTGVLSLESGYSGGHTTNPGYREICTGLTGHAEVVRITFDPPVITYREILDIFFTTHDPTTLNQQGNDIGTQYRSVIFYHTPEQQEIAEAAKKAAGEIWDHPVVTEISPAPEFFKAETYHQNYYKENPYQPYCSIVIAPKVRKMRELYRDKLKR
jgi:peptide-methionine (S)-S-oxide reductase